MYLVRFVLQILRFVLCLVRFVLFLIRFFIHFVRFVHYVSHLVRFVLRLAKYVICLIRFIPQLIFALHPFGSSFLSGSSCDYFFSFCLLSHFVLFDSYFVYLMSIIVSYVFGQFLITIFYYKDAHRSDVMGDNYLSHETCFP